MRGGGERGENFFPSRDNNRETSHREKVVKCTLRVRYCGAFSTRNSQTISIFHLSPGSFMILALLLCARVSIGSALLLESCLRCKERERRERRGEREKERERGSEIFDTVPRNLAQ